MITILHFSDAHIDIAAQGKHDPATGLPVRVLDFLNALDAIVDTAIQRRVDLVLFAGDVYKDRTPAPTFQREWGKRIMRLSQAGIPTLLLVGNHDLSPAAGRAHTLQEFETLQVPHVRVISKPSLLTPADLEGLPLQIIAIPWVYRSGLMAALQLNSAGDVSILEELESRLTGLIKGWINQVDPALPTVLAAHASVQGARYGNERSVMLGADLVLPGSLVNDPAFDYVALGHIHKAQNLGLDSNHPVVYPGSIERVDFGEAGDEKCFVIARLERGKTQLEWVRLPGRRFIDRTLRLISPDDLFGQVRAALPSPQEMEGAIFRLTLEYPREWDALLDEEALRKECEPALEFHLVRRPLEEARQRLPGLENISAIPPLEMLNLYWKTTHSRDEDTQPLQTLANQIFSAIHAGEADQTEAADVVEEITG